MNEKQLTHRETRWTKRAFPLILACNNWRDPRNVGMAFRLAEAFGLEAVWLGGTTPVPPNKKINKTARNTQTRVPYLHFADLTAALQNARADNYRLVGIEITDRSIPLQTYLQEKEIPSTVLVLGAERSGIAPEILAVLDDCVHIPMYGNNSSLNVATALAISINAWVTRWAG